MNFDGVTGNPISLIFPRANSMDELLAVLGDVQAFFTKWPSPPELFVPFLPPKTRYPNKGLQLLNNAGLGYGAAIKEALKRSRADFCFVLDLPLEYPLADVFQAWMEFESRPEVDIVVGSRRHPESQMVSNPPRWLWRFDSWINDRLHETVGSPVADATTSFYGFRVDRVRELTDDIRESGFSFGNRLVRRAERQRYGITEKPTHWTPIGGGLGRSARDQWSLIKLTFIEGPGPA